MITRDCGFLDAYLANDLADSARERFLEHAADCNACHREVELERQMRNRLMAGFEQFDSVPATISFRFRRNIANRRIERLALATSLLAAIGLGCWFAWSTTHRPSNPETASAHPAIASRTQPHVRVAFASNTGLIAVPVPSEIPNVSMFWVMPKPQSKRNFQ